MDVTSRTQLNVYANLSVPELWRYEKNQLKVYLLQGKDYQEVSASPTFPKLLIQELVAEVLAQSREIGRSPALRAFRKELKKYSTNN